MVKGQYLTKGHQRVHMGCCPPGSCVVMQKALGWSSSGSYVLVSQSSLDPQICPGPEVPGSGCAQMANHESGVPRTAMVFL